MRNIANLQLKPSISTRALCASTNHAQEPVSTRKATKHVIEILDAKYEKADIPVIRKLHLFQTDMSNLHFFQNFGSGMIIFKNSFFNVTINLSGRCNFVLGSLSKW